MYDTAKVALKELADDKLFEQLAVAVLSDRKFPGLRITGPSGDLGRDAFTRELFHHKDKVAVMVSLEREWTKKLGFELDKIEARPKNDRPNKAIFVTNRSTRQNDQKRYIERAKKLGTALEVFDLNELVQSLDTDELRPIAEAMLGVRPAQPRALLQIEEYLTTLAKTVTGIDAALVGRDAELQHLARTLDLAAGDQPRVVLVEGQGGMGKTRLAVQAAADVATTLVAATNVGLPPSSLTLIPLNAAAVLIVDDAHRSPDLSGIAAMFSDHRYDHVKVVLTCREGTTGSVLHRSGVDKYRPAVVKLEPLTPQHIEAIVTAHGFSDPAFVKTVIDISAGSPLIAHEICQHVEQHGRIGWSDVSNILEDLVDQRLRTAKPEDLDPTRAVAVALAVLGSARGARDIATLEGAVGRLPHLPDSIDRILSELADGGVAATARDHNGAEVFSMSPHMLAHVLVSTAIRHDARISLNVVKALGVLGRAAGGDLSGTDGILGIGPLPPGAYVQTRTLASQLEVLAQAADRQRPSSVGGLLTRAVFELLPDRPSFDDWETVLALAGPVAPIAPTLLDDLRTKIDQSWPPNPSESTIWWPGDDLRKARGHDFQRFVEQVTTLATRSGYANPAAAVRLLLTATVRANAELVTADLASIGKALQRIAHASSHDASATLDRRTRVVDAIIDWVNGQATASANAAVAPVDRSAWARVSVAALRVFLDPTFETTNLGFSKGSDIVLFGPSLLPDDPRLASSTTGAADAISAVIGAASFEDDAGISGSLPQSLIDLPHELRNIGLRGLSQRTGALPDYARNLLDASARTITAALAARWSDLPLAARHHAAKQSVERRGARGTYRSLAQRAVSGDVLAGHAVADSALAPVLTLVPVGINELGCVDGNTSGWRRTETRRRKAAEALAASMSWRDGVELLAVTAPLADDGLAEAPRKWFARRLVSNLVPDATDELLDTLADFDYPLPHEADLIEALVPDGNPERLDNLERRATTPRGGELLLHTFRVIADTDRSQVSAILLDLIRPPAADDPNREVDSASSTNPNAKTTPRPNTNVAAVIAAVTDFGERRLSRLARRVPVVSTVVAALASRNSDAPADADTHPETQPDETPVDDSVSRARLAQSFAYQVFWSNWQGRADTLLAIGEICPPAVLVHVLRLIAMCRTNNRQAPLTTAQWAATVPLLRRRLDSATPQIPNLLDDYDTARLIRVLAVEVPDALAAMLAKLLAAPDNDRLRWDSAWRTIFVEVPSAERTPFAVALTREVEADTELLPNHARFDLDQAMGEICAGTAGWETGLLALANGSQSDRDRAIASIAQLWKEPAWAPVVSTLLRSGLTSEQLAMLANGIDMTSFGHKDQERVDRRRAALASITPAHDPAVADFVAQANAQIDRSIAMFHRTV